jgi:hypothetical protein
MATAALIDYLPFSQPERVRRAVRPVQNVAPPPLVGWRLNTFGKHLIQNQLIKRHYRREVSGWYSSARETREKAATQPARRVVHQVAQDARKLFEVLAAKWQDDTAFLSSVSDVALHPAYQRIVGMGPAALPLIFRDLKNAPNHWFWALNAITGENPVPEENWGDIAAMRNYWLEWGKERGLVE